MILRVHTSLLQLQRVMYFPRMEDTRNAKRLWEAFGHQIHSQPFSKIVVGIRCTAALLVMIDYP